MSKPVKSRYVITEVDNGWLVDLNRYTDGAVRYIADTLPDAVAFILDIGEPCKQDPEADEE